NGFGQTGGGKYQNGDTFEGEFQRKQDDPSFTIDNSDKTDSSDKDDRPKS
ncbi:TPA: membrane protein FxsA, partial [Providencia rettgeri]|nr:membrane protein FxsA [Providencia rettgeri]